MTVSVVGSNNETVVFQTRKVKGSDLETDATLLDLDDIPMPSGVLDSNNQTYANFTALYADLPTNQNIRGPQGPQGPAIDSVSLAQSVDLSTVTMSFGYTLNNQGYTVGTTPSFTIPAGPTGPTGTGIQFVSHDTQNHTLTFQFTDTLSDLTVDLPQGDTGPAGRSISSISKSGDVMTINYDDGSSPTQISGIRGPAGDAATVTVSATNTLAAGASATVTETGTSNSQNRELIFNIPAGADGDDGVSVTDVNQVNATTVNFSLSDSTTTSNITLPSATASSILPSYTNNAGKVLAVNSNANDIEWIAGSGTGTVTSVGLTGANGISVTGSPVTTSGSIGVSLSLGANLTYNTSTQQIDATDTDTTYSVATTSADGLLSSTDKSKLDGIAVSANNYALPIAAANSLGGIKVGANLTINNSTGVLDATDTDTTYSVVTTSVDGLMSSTDKSKLDGIATNANNYALPIATANDLGGFKVGTNLTINSTTGVLDATDTNTTYSVVTTSAHGLMSSTDKTKLDGVAANANNYSLPIATVNALGGFKVGTNLTINSTTGVLDATDTNTTYSVATTSADGLMSSSDKTKLDSVATSANNYSLPTASSSVLGGVKVGANLSITNGVLDATDTDTTYSVATTSANGLMSGTDKTKLDGIAANANNYSLPIASASALGGFKVGTNLSIDASTGVLSATGGGGSTVDPVVMALALG
ncbi:MAG: hypothetical protein CBC12_10745 [Candidatus Puniceispirillum sp. TMED52]|nr:MAG: hypothetical protein CBC12_10745 [Candidatus Puniceispirillum sp. TMED52]